MKAILQQKTHQTAANHELVRLYLDIGQCRFIHKLLTQEFERMRLHAVVDKNFAVSALLDQFEQHAYPSVSLPVHRDVSLDDYIDSNDEDDINMLLASVYVPGVFTHD